MAEQLRPRRPGASERGRSRSFFAQCARRGAGARAPDFDDVLLVVRVHSAASCRRYIDAIDVEDLIGVDRRVERVKQTASVRRGLPANNVLLWGARGTGKSSLVHAL